jgi:Bacterial regulatory proteins, luxR family
MDLRDITVVCARRGAVDQRKRGRRAERGERGGGQAGSSTRQAASQMFLSPRTIDAHLRSIYAKLGITSRTELRAADLDEITQDAAK